MTSRLATAFFISLALSGGVLAQYTKPQTASGEASKKQVGSQQSSRTGGDGKSDASKSRNPDRPDFLGAPAIVVVPDRR